MTEKRQDDEAAAPARLLADFPPADLAAWREEVTRQLKGGDFETAMLTPTYEGITLRPLYTSRDAADWDHDGSWPGGFPLVRGTRALGYRERPWDVVQELPFPAAAAMGAALRQDLERGQNAVTLVLDEAGSRGQDPDEAGAGVLGRDGTSVATTEDLERAFAGIDLARHPFYLRAGAATPAAVALVLALCQRQGCDVANLSGCAGYDPWAELARRGVLPAPAPHLYREIAALTRWAAAHAPGLRTVVAAGLPYHEAGGSGVHELAFAAAAAVAHLRALEQAGLEPAAVAPHLVFEFGIGTHFFLEIAKLRAARMIWAQIARCCGLANSAAAAIHLHARTSRFVQTAFDPHVNLLRGTTAAMAAILGGVDSLTVAPFDAPLGPPSERARRLALNTHTILRDEAHLDAVVDPAGGSWCVGSLTAELARKAWDVFQEIEAGGGLGRALETGEVQGRVAAVADQRAQDVALGRSVIVGVNSFVNADEGPPAAQPRVSTTLVERLREAVRQWRKQRGASATAALTRLGESAAAGDDNLVATLIAAATEGATLGELTHAQRATVPGGPTANPLTPRRAAAPFEAIRRAVLARRAADADAGRVVFCCLGDVAWYRPRLDFARDFFAAGGFVVEQEGFYTEAGAATEAARATGAPTAVLVGRDETYAELAAEAARRLKTNGGPATLILAGYPKPLVAGLQAAGVDIFIHARAHAVEILTELARRNGVEL